MVFFIAGATHTGKTLLAQRMLEQYSCPYLSIDHLKMGLIRSGHTTLTPKSPAPALQDYLWPIVREIAKTAIENSQSLMIEGCYIPYHLQEEFGAQYQPHIKPLWLIFSERYLCQQFDAVLRYESVVEKRLAGPPLCKEALSAACRQDLEACKLHHLPYVLIDECYPTNLDLFA